MEYQQHYITKVICVSGDGAEEEINLKGVSLEDFWVDKDEDAAPKNNKEVVDDVMDWVLDMKRLIDKGKYPEDLRQELDVVVNLIGRIR